MTDFYGAEALPATPGAFGQKAPDKALDSILAYLAAVLPVLAGDRWAAIAPRTKVVESTYTSHPKDLIVNSNHLPGLFAWRGRFKQDREAEDYLITRTELGLMWLLWWDGPAKREIYLPFQGIVTKAIHSALARGRHPSWAVAGDTEPGAAERGSVLKDQMGLVEPIEKMNGDLVDITLDLGGNAVRYKAWTVNVMIAERMVRDPALFSVPTISTTDPDNANPGGGYPQPAALDLTVAQGEDNTIEQLQPQG